jgi:hypothetical protein
MSHLSVATWNVHHHRSTAAIRGDLNDVLASDVQLLGLNEVGGHEAAVATRRANIGHFQAQGHPGIASCALMWRTDVLQLVRTGTRLASKAVYVGPRGAGPATMPPKYVTWAQFTHVHTRRNVFALASHFPATIEVAGKPNVVLRRRLKVTHEMWVTNEWLVSRFLDRGQVVVMGDLNWNAETDDGSYADAPRAAAARMGLKTSYEALGLPPQGTKGNRFIDYVLYPKDRTNTFTAVSQRIFDVNPDPDHRVLAVDFSVQARRAR